MEKSEKVAIEDFELLEYNSKLDTVTTGLSEDVACPGFCSGS